MTLRVSTIKPHEIIPEATRAIQRFVKSTNTNRILPYFGSHITLDDLVMDTCEKVISANPMYLTKSYVWVAARCVCIDHLQRKKLPWLPSDKVNPTLFDPETEAKSSLEELIEGDAYDYLTDLEDEVEKYLGEDLKAVYRELLTGKMYVEIAEDLDISLRTLERRVHELKWVLEYILTGEDPYEKTHPVLF